MMGEDVNTSDSEYGWWWMVQELVSWPIAFVTAYILGEMSKEPFRPLHVSFVCLMGASVAVHGLAMVTRFPHRYWLRVALVFLMVPWVWLAYFLGTP